MIYKYLSEKFPKTLLNINNAQTDNFFFSVLQYQPKGDLSYCPTTGVKSSASENELEALFKLNEDTNADLLITPECAIPFSYIKKVINKKTEKLYVKKLWCLCCEGIAYREFIEYINELSQVDDLIVINDNSNIDIKKHVNSLWYMFRTQDNKIAIVVQLKTGPMKDPDFNHEANDLSTGDIIYTFDLSENKTNIFISLICADIMHVNQNKMLTAFNQNSLLIFNPQLNPNPNADAFVNFRSALFTANTSKSMYIGLNWAMGTKLNSKELIEFTGSSFCTEKNTVFGNDSVDKILSDDEALSQRRQLHCQGIYYAYNKPSHYNKWTFDNDAHMNFYRIKKGYINQRPSTPPTNHEPIRPYKYSFNIEQKKWIESNSHEKNIEWLCKVSKAENIPFKCDKDNCKTAGCSMVYNDYFIALCFGQHVKTEVTSTNEQGERTIIALSKEDNVNQTKKIRRLNTLFENLENGEVPEELQPMFDNIEFAYSKNSAERGSTELYNIKFNDLEYPYKKGIAAIILDDCNEDYVKKIYKDLKDRTREEYQDQILLYYSESGDGYMCYSEPHGVSGFKKSVTGFTKETESIKRG